MHTALDRGNAEESEITDPPATATTIRECTLRAGTRSNRSSRAEKKVNPVHPLVHPSREDTKRFGRPPTKTEKTSERSLTLYSPVSYHNEGGHFDVGEDELAALLEPLRPHVPCPVCTPRGRTTAGLAVREGQRGRFASCTSFGAGPDHHCGHTERVCENCEQGLMIRMGNGRARCQNPTPGAGSESPAPAARTCAGDGRGLRSFAGFVLVDQRACARCAGGGRAAPGEGECELKSPGRARSAGRSPSRRTATTDCRWSRIPSRSARSGTGLSPCSRPSSDSRLRAFSGQIGPKHQQGFALMIRPVRTSGPGEEGAGVPSQAPAGARP